MDIKSATGVVDRDFTTFDTARQGDSAKADGKISREDLETVSRNESGKFSAEQQEAARFLLDSEASRAFLDVSADKGFLFFGGKVDGTISREDVTAAQKTLESGSYYDELLDTAAGRGGQDGNISNDDIVAALADPGVPQELKDTLNLLLAAPDGSKDLHQTLQGFTEQEVGAVSELSKLPQFQALSGSDKRLVAEAVRDSGGDLATNTKLRELLDGDRFKGMSAEQRTAALTEIALVETPEFKALPASDQALIRDAVTNRKPDDVKVAENIKKLIEDPKFAALSADEKTAVLSQVKNYPDSRSVANIERLIQKDWFGDFDLADKQRTLKSIAFMSQNDAGDPEVNKNTLNRVLDPSSKYVFAWDASFDGDLNSGGGLYGTADGTNITFNSNMVNAGNDPLTETYNSRHVVLHTIAHEVNHNVNGDKVENTYNYLEQEYRAFYTGFKAEFGHPPTNEDAMGRWRNQINGAYSARSQAAIDSSPTEARKFAEELSLITGKPVPAGASHDELKQFIQDQLDLPVSDYADPTGPAPVPPGNLTNE